MIAFLFFLGLLFAVGPSPAAQHPPADYRISGVLVDAVTGAPVPDAEVSISLDADVNTTTTADDGRFVFQHLEPAKYSLFATAQGYVREQLNQHGGFYTGVAVGAGLDSEHIIFRLHPQAIIAGTVTDEHGEAVRHAQAWLFSTESGGGSGSHARSERAQTETNDLGQFRFAGLWPGKYFVAIFAHPWYARTSLDYVPTFGSSGPIFSGLSRTQQSNPSLDVVYPLTFYPGVTDAQAAGELDLVAGETELADVQLQAVPAVHIRVTNLLENGQSQNQFGADIKLFGSFQIGLNISSGRIAPGEYEVAGLPPGNVSLSVMQIGNRGGVPQWYPRRINLNVTDGDTVDGAGTGATANVSGKVILPAGYAGPLKANVELNAVDSQDAAAPLDKDGVFSLAPLQEGTYKVLVNFTDAGLYVRRISAAGAKVAGREITIADAGDVHLTITLGEGFGSVSGVAQLDGRPAAGVMILLVPQSGEDMETDYRMDQSDSDGTFALGRIIPGKYLLMAIDDGWDLEWTKASVLQPYLVKAQTIQVSADNQQKVTVPVQHKNL